MLRNNSDNRRFRYMGGITVGLLDASVGKMTGSAESCFHCCFVSRPNILSRPIGKWDPRNKDD